MNSAGPINVEELAGYQRDAIVSRTLIDRKTGTVTFFAFDEGQGLSEHSAPYDALVYIAEGEAEVKVSGEPYAVKEGEMLLIPAKAPHELRAAKRFKMILTMIR
jgi:quercetin dioxygenase-like cupin family protein